MRRFVLVIALLAVSCRTSEGLRRDYLERIRSAQPEPSVPVIVIPGFGVSRLYDSVAERYVWGIPRNAIHLRYEDDLDLPLDGVENDRLVARGFTGSRGPINSAWQLSAALQKFGRYREESEKVSTSEASLFGFAYDWRQSASTNAVALDALIERIRAGKRDPNLRVDLVAHSAGGMVALTYLRIGGAPLDRAEDWERAAQRARSKVRRVVLIAPPQRGVVDAFRIFVEPERFIRRTFHPETVATWPAVAELLPFDGRFLVDERGKPLDADLHTLDGWRSIGAGPYDARVAERMGNGVERQRKFALLLDRARLFREAMLRPLPPDIPLQVIAGDCVLTARKVLRRSATDYVFYPNELHAEEEKLRALLFTLGDGTVPGSSAVPAGEAQFFCDGHQGLTMDPSVHRALLRFLSESGRPANPKS